MGKQPKIFATNRQKNIVEYVNRKNSVTVDDLVKYCGVSPATIRNDLQELAKTGFIRRTHGGAVSIQSALYTDCPPGWSEETNFSKSQYQKTEKYEISRKALSYIHDGDNIMLDAGTTTLQLAQLLGQFRNLNVTTYDVDIAHYLIHNTNVNVYFAGGHVRADLFYCDSFETAELLQRFKVTCSFLSANGVSLDDGLTSSSPETTGIKRILIENSQRTILLADSSKLGKTTFFQFADLKQADILITDKGADPDFVKAVQSLGVSVDCV